MLPTENTKPTIEAHRVTCNGTSNLDVPVSITNNHNVTEHIDIADAPIPDAYEYDAYEMLPSGKS